MFRSKTFEQAQDLLHDEFGLDTTLYQTPAATLLLAEAVNWAAKISPYNQDRYYDLKPQLIMEALDMGASGGWGRDSYGTYVFYLFHKDTGVASFHDPGDAIHVPLSVRWSHPWSGLHRQSCAHEIWQSFRGYDGCRLLERWRYATVPGKTHSYTPTYLEVAA